MKILIGKVTSTKMQKTATVSVERVVIHPIYKKRFKKIKNYHVHDELGAKVGDSVKFVACKPYSKLKKWKIIEIIAGRSVSKIRGKGKIPEKVKPEVVIPAKKQVGKKEISTKSKNKKGVNK